MMGRDSSAMGPFFFSLFLVCAACTGLSIYLAKKLARRQAPVQELNCLDPEGPSREHGR